jgi:signal peptidase I
MEPAFQRGDLLFLGNRGQDTKVGEIVVYNVKGKDIPIVHRVVRRFGGGSGYAFFSPFLLLPFGRKPKLIIGTTTDPKHLPSNSSQKETTTQQTTQNSTPEVKTS